MAATKDDAAQLDRRTVLSGLTAAAAAAAVLPAGALAANARPTDFPGKSVAGAGTHALEEAHRAPVLSPVEATFFAGLDAGRRFGEATLVSVFPLNLGAVSVVMELHGSRFQVDLLKADAQGPQAPEQTAQLAFFVSNQGNGQRLTENDQHVAVRALSDVLAARDASALGLMTFDERRLRFPRGIYDAG
ncbi:MAG: hypothetical protein IPJ65_15285 [Archangiaceae bacterium]|nr:hypothetical protein [Archangiaceae bacterium]